MKVQAFEDPKEFGRRVTPLLLRHEAQNCFFLGQISTLAAPTETLLLAITDHDGEVVGVANRTPPDYPLMISDLSPGTVAALADHLRARRINLSGVNGPPSEEFARAWLQRAKATPRREMELGIFQADQVIPPTPAPGFFRVASPADLDRIIELYDAFGGEIGEPTATKRDAVLRRIQEQRSFVWELNGQIVSTAGWAGQTPNGVRINAVYTPPEHRGKGYASNCVAALTRHMLDTGRRFCFLYTDLANPTSNKIYQSIGYQRVGGSLKFMFH
jgi:predicted GNAT family acetyltransferase